MAKKIFALLITICSGAVLFAAAPESDAGDLRKEIQELRKKLLAQEKELANYRIWLASLGIDYRKNSVPEREKHLLYTLEELSRCGNLLSMAALTVGDECRKLLVELPLGPARKAQIKIRLDELDRAAGKFAGLTIPGDANAGSCRLLAVSDDLQVVVLSAGAGAGVFPGMIFYVKNDPQLKFRVIGTRFEGAVAELAEGNWSDVVPGMEVSAFQKVKEPEKLIKR
ncbi:MAG: hypothetical protein J6W00_14030 [Lentisphaeria bacterium]|nr:hypothetical protein [Lentisphaeria bacterium]